MGAVMKRFLDWANQPVNLGRTKQKELDAIPEVEVSKEIVPLQSLPENIAALNLNLDSLTPANDAIDGRLDEQPPEPKNPEDYLGVTAEDAVDGLERYLSTHAISDASELSWVHLMDEMKVIKLKRKRLAELESECVKIKSELLECKKSLAMQAQRASTEESMSILMHEKRLELAKAVSRRIDAL